jgi:hypothetical protein
VNVERLRCEPARVRIGGKVAISFVVRSTARTAQRLVVDVAVHFVKPRRRASRKVFRVKRIELAARATAALGRQISLAVHTTRVPHVGKHAVDVIVNGAVKGSGSFDVVRGRTRTDRDTA